MPDQTRDALKRLADSMLRAGGQQATPVSAPPSSLPAVTPPTPPAAPPKARELKSHSAGIKQSGRRPDGTDGAQRVRP